MQTTVPPIKSRLRIRRVPSPPSRTPLYNPFPLVPPSLDPSVSFCAVFHGPNLSVLLVTPRVASCHINSSAHWTVILINQVARFIARSTCPYGKMVPDFVVLPLAAREATFVGFRDSSASVVLRSLSCDVLTNFDPISTNKISLLGPAVVTRYLQRQGCVH